MPRKQTVTLLFPRECRRSGENRKATTRTSTRTHVHHGGGKGKGDRLETRSQVCTYTQSDPFLLQHQCPLNPTEHCPPTFPSHLAYRGAYRGLASAPGFTARGAMPRGDPTASSQLSQLAVNSAPQPRRTGWNSHRVWVRLCHALALSIPTLSVARSPHL